MFSKQKKPFFSLSGIQSKSDVRKRSARREVFRIDAAYRNSTLSAVLIAASASFVVLDTLLIPASSAAAAKVSAHAFAAGIRAPERGADIAGGIAGIGA